MVDRYKVGDYCHIDDDKDGDLVNYDDYAALELQNKLLKKLLAAVHSSEFDGFKFDDVDGKNWFVLQSEVLK